MLVYFLQVNVCWLLFYGVYYALLSKETFFRLNRTWLIISLLCGLVLPFAADYFAVKVAPAQLFALTLEPFVVTATALKHNLVADTEGVVLDYLAIGYAIGVAVLAARFLAGLFLIFKLWYKSKKEPKAGFTLVYTDGTSRNNREGGQPPFSFFNFIFINPYEFELFDYQQIVEHEEAHVRQKHSFDVVFLELLNIVFWCSPLIYFYKESLRNVHEYLADEAVLRTSATPQYGRLLLKQRESRMALSLTSNISNHFFSQLKKRILMMTRNKSKRTALIKYALAAPIFLILTAALASPKTPILAKTEALSDKVVTAVDKLEKADLNTVLAQVNGNQAITLSKQDSIPSSVLNMKDGESRVYIGDYNFNGAISVSEFQKTDKLKTVMMYGGKLYEGNIQSYVLVRVPKNGDPMQVNVTGSVNAEVKKVFALAKDGDFFQFLNIKGRWLDDKVSRDIGSLSFGIKDNAPQYPTKPADIIEKPLKNLKLVDKQKAGKGTVYTIVDQNPEFPQGQAAMFKWLGQNIKYPVTARQAGGEGTVYVGFIVETDGSITNVNIKRDVPVIVRDTITIIEVNGMKGNKFVERTDYSLGKEAMRVISAMPKWKPGQSKGVAVRVAYTLPIKFKLE
jgi:hypothetical protein